MDEETKAGYDAMRIASQEKRAHNRGYSTQLLMAIEAKETGLKVTLLKDDVHLMVSYDGNEVDFWPGTGRWIFRGLPGRRDPNAPRHTHNGRGVLELLKTLGVPEEVIINGNARSTSGGTASGTAGGKPYK